MLERLKLQHVRIGMVILCVMGLSACSGDARRTLGLEQAPPDEFAVSPAVPLSVPPDFSLRPPNPGENRPQDVTTSQQAQKTLLGASIASANQPSAGTVGLLAKSGGDRADPSIRTQLDRETSLISQEEPAFTERLLFWQSKAEPGVILNPTQEAERLRANKAAGLAAGAGAATPVIERSPKRAPLEGVRDAITGVF